MSILYTRLHTLVDHVATTQGSSDRGHFIECPNAKEFTNDERNVAFLKSACCCKIYRFQSSNIIDTLYATVLFHHQTARNYFSKLEGIEGDVKVVFHLKKDSTEESFKSELLLKITVFTCKVLNGWEEVKPLSESEPTTYQKENNSLDIEMFFKSIVCLLFPTFEGDEEHTVKVKQVGPHLTLKGCKWHILQMFDSLHPTPPVRLVTPKDRTELSHYYNHEVSRLSSASTLEAQKWCINCLAKLLLLLKE